MSSTDKRAQPKTQSVLRFVADPSSILLIGANLITLGVTIWYGWGIGEVFMVYWLQTVIILAVNMTKLHQLVHLRGRSTVLSAIQKRGIDMKSDGVSIHKTKQPISWFAFKVNIFFLLMIYLFSSLVITGGISVLGQEYIVPILLSTASFGLSHLFSFFSNWPQEKEGIDSTMLLENASYRLYPLFAIMFFASMFSSTTALFLFIGIKTIVDVSTHAVEHSRRCEV